MNEKCFRRLRGLPVSIIHSLFIGMTFLLLTQIGCSKEEVVAQPVNQPATQPVANNTENSKQDEPDQEATDEFAPEEKSALRKAAELLKKAQSSGGDSAGQATKWMQDVLGDASESGGATAQGALDWTNDMYQSLKDQGLTTAGSTTEWLSEDWNKMGAWEYKVIALEGMSPTEMESKLNELGAQRWECFHVASSPNGQTMYFKKHAKSYLKHVPLKDMMKLIPLLDAGNE